MSNPGTKIGNGTPAKEETVRHTLTLTVPHTKGIMELRRKLGLSYDQDVMRLGIAMMLDKYNIDLSKYEKP